MASWPAKFLVWLSVCVAGLTLIPGAIAGSILPPAEVSLILEAGRFKTLHSAKEVPVDVLKKCFPHGAPADPGKPWNQTDVVTDANLPFSRAVWLATDGTYWLVAWEHGGIAYSAGFMMIANRESAVAAVVWDAGPATKTLETFPEFQEYVRSKGVFLEASTFRP